jgi:hypothetical protein
MGARVGNSHVTSHPKYTISAFSAILQDCVAARYSPIPTRIQGLPDSISPDKSPRNFKEAMARDDKVEWMAAYQAEYQGFKDRDALMIARPPTGTKILTKILNVQFIKRKARVCVRGDLQTEGEDYFQQDLYSPTLKATETRLIAAIAAQHGAQLFKTDCKQAFLYGELDDAQIYIRPPDWWPEKLPEGHALLLLKAIYGTKQAARKWHTRISGWLVDHHYEPANSEQTIFVKKDGKDFIIHGLFVDDMQHASTSEKLWQEFLTLYSRDFEITGGDLMKDFLGLEIVHINSEIHLHMDSYVQSVIYEWKHNCGKMLQPKSFPAAPNHNLTKEDCSTGPNPDAKHYRSCVMKLMYVAQSVRFDICFAVCQLSKFCSNPGPTHKAA